jgi:hypothetical protein
MSRHPALWIVAAACLLGTLPGCGKMKVDCERLCQRTYQECGAELRLVKGRLDRAGAEEVQKQPAKAERFRKQLAQERDTCLKRCKEKKGYGSDAAKFNDCLKKKTDCRSYAACVKDLVN